MITVKVSADGRITIPKAIRDRLKFLPGTELILEERGDTVILKRLIPAKPHH